MPRKRLTMRKIRGVLRLKAAGSSISDIADSTGTPRTTVYEYLVRAEATGLAWPLPAELDDEALEAAVPAGHGQAGPAPARCRTGGRSTVSSVAEKARDIAAVMAGVEGRANPEGWGYSQFCSHYERWLQWQDVVMRLSYPAGERMFVDFSGDKVPVTGPLGGEVAQAKVFVAVFGCSGISTSRPPGTRGSGGSVMAHVHAWEAYGGVTWRPHP